MRLDDHTNLYLSFGKSFAPPLLYQLYRYAEPSYGGRYEPNPSLKPETTTNWELGIKKTWGNKNFRRPVLCEDKGLH